MSRRRSSSSRGTLTAVYGSSIFGTANLDSLLPCTKSRFYFLRVVGAHSAVREVKSISSEWRSGGSMAISQSAKQAEVEVVYHPESGLSPQPGLLMFGQPHQYASPGHHVGILELAVTYSKLKS
ncbi:hypothetical protein Hypma_000156 [Hypsizygus marmoreus]|uniref:Uncharacterized protein n=1 Tax=Hypsizygus marmoreus TaxID=39966 RepID=A0A369KDM9_HYPMA|nr:hypothetical protein Hypma_000156 [Hypsizygus marmoreus]